MGVFGSEDRCTSMVKRGGNANDNGESVPLASQGKLMNGKTDVGIGLNTVELVSVAKDKIGFGRWRKKLRK